MSSERNPCTYLETIGRDRGWRPCGEVADHGDILCAAGCGEAFAHCENHGGAERARLAHDAHLLTCWHAVAPASLPRDEIEARGSMLTDTEHHIGVVRSIDAEQYTAAVGLGGHARTLPGFFPTALAAETAARKALAQAYEERVTEIRAARGGSLEWGLPLVPPVTTILFCAPGVSAWEAMGRREEMVGVEEVARRLGVSDETIRRRIRQGAFPGARQDQVPGGWRWMIPSSEIPAELPPATGRPRPRVH